MADDHDSWSKLIGWRRSFGVLAGRICGVCIGKLPVSAGAQSQQARCCPDYEGLRRAAADAVELSSQVRTVPSGATNCKA